MFFARPAHVAWTIDTIVVVKFLDLLVKFNQIKVQVLFWLSFGLDLKTRFDMDSGLGSGLSPGAYMSSRFGKGAGSSQCNIIEIRMFTEIWTLK